MEALLQRVTGYSYALEGLIHVIWVLMPEALDKTGAFEVVRLYNLNWIIPLVWGGCVAGVMLLVFHRYNLSTGSIISAIRGVHDDGAIPLSNVLPMLFVSLVTITAGGSAGPEASVIVMGGALMEALNRFLRQPLRERRILTMCGMSAALAAFFGERAFSCSCV